MNNLRTINALATGLAEGTLKLLGQEYWSQQPKALQREKV
jgi:hypothetical protein